MENQIPEKKKNVYLISGLVFIVLFILPLGSIYFLNSGLQYRKTSVAELGDLGKIGAFNLKNQNNLPITPELLKGRVTVVNFLSQNDSTAKYQADRIAKVHQNYNGVDDVVFISFIQNDSTKSLIDLASQMGIENNKQWHLLSTNDNQWEDFSFNAFKIPDNKTGVALVDTSLTVRRIYDISSNPEMGRLVEQIAIVMPKQKRRGL